MAQELLSRSAVRWRSITKERNDTAGLVLHATGWYLANRLVTALALGLSLFIIGEKGTPRELMKLGDGIFYLDISKYGYFDLPTDTGDKIFSSIGFFPLLPGLIRAFNLILPGDEAVAGFAVCALAGWMATVAVALLGREIYDDATGRRAAALLCAFPGSMVFSIVYTEGLMLTGAAAALILLRRERWFWAGIAGAVATAARPSGAAVVVAAVVVAAVAVYRRRDWLALMAPAMASLGMASYLAYLWARTGRPNAWFDNQSDFWRQKNNLGGYVIDWFRMLGHTHWQRFDHYMFGWIMLFLLPAIVYFFKRRPDLASSVYVGASLFITLSSSLGPRPRFLLAAFPMLLPFANRLQGTRFERTIAIGFGLLAILTLYYAVGTWAAIERTDYIGTPVI